MLHNLPHVSMELSALGLLAQVRAITLLDWADIWLLIVLLVLLAAAYGVGLIVQRQPDTVINPALARAFTYRVRAWWLIYAVLGVTFLMGRVPIVILFFAASFWALREFITVTPTRLGDHRALFWVFFIFTPLQYLLVGLGWTKYQLIGTTIQFEIYRTFSNLIPIYAFLFVPARVAFAGDYKRFLERVAKIQAGLMICVFALSHAPALLNLELVDSAGQPWQGGRAGVLFFFVLVVQISEISHYACGHFLGKHPIAPAISRSKTWEGLLGGILGTMLIGTALWWVTPFRPWQATLMALVIAITGFAGSMTMSAVKRDRNVTDYGTLVVGHAGVMDRIDSICFAAPVFFHLTRFFFAN
ncbi:MAG: phosphatidate cytidylyltransferase [Pirellulaceae bacterium]